MIEVFPEPDVPVRIYRFMEILSLDVPTAREFFFCFIHREHPNLIKESLPNPRPNFHFSSHRPQETNSYSPFHSIRPLTKLSISTHRMPGRHLCRYVQRLRLSWVFS